VASDASTVSVDPRRNPKGDFDLHEAVRYAKSKGIGVWVYVNRRQLEQKLDTLLPLYKSWGVDGIKFGFVHVGSHRWTVWLHEAVKKCARHQLMVNIHDEYRPTGFSRTYPNLMTQEGVRGNEEMPDATHNTVLPFTRYLAGAGGYTVSYYQRSEIRPELKAISRYIRPTPAHQLALPVVFYSPLQWLFWYDLPEDFRDEPELEFWKHLPTTWDDTRIVAGEIGQYAGLARRKGEDWYVGLITNNQARQVALSLSFLDKKKRYLAYVYTDGDEAIPTRTKVKTEVRKVTHASVLSFPLKPQGGVAIRIVAQSHKGE
jgi:alpha-glucosidase